MATKNEDKDELRRNINEMKQGSIEEMLLIIKYCIKAYFKSAYTFGNESRVTRDNLNIIKEMFQILRRERTLLNFILRNIDFFDITSSEEVVGMLDNLNDRTIEYYYGLINDIEDAAELGQEFRGYRPTREEKTLINDNTFTAEVISLGIGKEEIKEFLDYEDEFWMFLRGKEKEADTSVEVLEKIIHATPVTQDGKIVDIELLVPRIYSKQTAELAIRTYEQAYKIYSCLGLDIETLKTQEGEQAVERYNKNYLERKAKEFLKRKNVN